ncbi:glycosyltransferase family 2 protein [Helicobacter sp. MIT 14-3879]|uniref:glycosyltransferase family 2 protein n=1 Tax=Helicobacter sp. MIT 14-3879 TaxID=2040649 RepID=UPI000E1E74F8|nr:glycosyltransferase family 2 protein [Helicobacter sp. MIT 14-3879]RDU65475.1 hypothetical protein CQA44_00330 [Helicobacter sp. MIT 14-3879]
MPKISIVIPIFNVQNFLKKSIESCINQSFNDIEVILIDDKSTDSSLDIAKGFKDDLRIKVISNEINVGTFLARAKGIEAVSGEYILFLDSDDYLREDSLESLYSLAKKSDADMINFGIINEPFVKNATLPKVYDNEIIGDEIANEVFIKNFKKSWFILCSRMFKTTLVKKALQKLSFIDRHLISSEDSILFFVICVLARKSVGINENFYIYCANPNSIMRSRDRDRLLKQIEDRRYLDNCLYKLCDDKELTQNIYFKECLFNLSNLLNYFICFSKRFLKSKELNDKIPPYIKYSILSMKYMPRWQIIAKLGIFILTFGYKKL